MANKTKGYAEVYIGLPYLKENREYVDKLRVFAKTYAYKTVAFPSLKYEKEDDAIALEILLTIQRNANLPFKEKKGDEHFLKNEEIVSFYNEDEIKATEEIFNECKDFELIKKRGGASSFPK